MKKKMVLDVVFVVLFVLQGQAVFAQSNNFNPRIESIVIDINGKLENVTDRVIPVAGINIETGLFTIMIMFKDGSDITYQFTDASLERDGSWALGNGTRINSSTGRNFPGNYWGGIGSTPLGGGRSIQIYNDRGKPVLGMAVTGL